MRRISTVIAVIALAAAPAAFADPSGEHGQGADHSQAGEHPAGDQPNHGANGNHGEGNNGHHNGAGNGGGKGHSSTVTYVFKGTYSGDGSTVAVTSGNSHVDRAGLTAQSVAFDFANAKLTVADTNADGAETLADVAAGDSVLVTARLPKSAPGTAPYAARGLVDQTHPPASS